MSTLSTANIQSKAANTPPVIKDVNGTECGQFARAWITLNYDESPLGTGLDSFNVGSVTDNGAGDFTITFANAMPNANYAVIGMVANTNNNFSTQTAAVDRGPSAMHLKGTTAPTTTAFRIETRYGSSASNAGANQDFSRNYVVVFGG